MTDGYCLFPAPCFGGFQIIDISNPTKPAIIGNLDMGSAYDIQLTDGPYLYVSGGDLLIIDVSNPQAPRIAESIPLPGDANGMAVSGNHAYVAGGRSGLQVVDVSDLSKPAVIGSVDSGTSEDVAVAGNHVFVTDVRFELFVYSVQCSEPSSLPSPSQANGFWLGRTNPNPFHDATKVAFSLPQGGAAELSVYDAHGRLVTKLIEGERPSGGHQMRWDGRDRSGRLLPAGVYFLRLESAGHITAEDRQDAMRQQSTTRTSPRANAKLPSLVR